MSPTLDWKIGAAYDLLISLHVLHLPERFGLRPAWAAGVRNRLLPEERKLLRQAQNLFKVPLLWLHEQPGAANPAALFTALAALPAGERLAALALTPEVPEAVRTVLLEISARRAWEPADLERLDNFAFIAGKPLQAADLEHWAHPAEFGERYLAALQSYHAVYFAEEEQRIMPALRRALERAQDLASRVDVLALVETLSRGVHFPGLDALPGLVLVPSYWITPLVFASAARSGSLLFVFGARPDEAGPTPGDPVPAALLAALKALADPTRLGVLRLLCSESLTLSQVAQRLRLRPPTMIHHLNALRLAGLVQVDLQPDGEKRYTVRRPAVKTAFQALEQFLDQPA